MEPVATTAPPTPAVPETPTTPALTKVSFSSNPTGARVISGSSILGITPLQQEMEPADANEFQFELDGYQVTKVTAPIQGESSIVHATLIADAPEPPEPPPEVVEEPPAAPAKVVRPYRPRFGKGRRPPRPAPVAVEPPPVVEPPPPPPVVEPPHPAKRPPRPTLIVDDPRGAVPVVD